MTRAFTSPPNWRRGDGVTAAKLQQTSNAVTELQRSVHGRQDDLPLGAVDTETTPVLIAQATVVQEFQDAVEVDADLGNGTERFFARKPPLLRGHVASRTVNGEYQEILPPYSVGDQLMVIGMLQGDRFGLTGSAASDGRYYTSFADARVWAEIPQP